VATRFKARFQSRCWYDACSLQVDCVLTVQISVGFLLETNVSCDKGVCLIELGKLASTSLVLPTTLLNLPSQNILRSSVEKSTSVTITGS
jgi:hypothetical protein